MAETNQADEFAAYFRSDLHKKRMEESIVRNAERLAAMGKSDAFASFSEAIGMAFAVGQYYRLLGLKHQGAAIFREIFHWMKKGTD